jgi:hypothetical protein
MAVKSVYYPAMGLFQRIKVWLDIMGWDYRTLRERKPPTNALGYTIRFMCQHPFGVVIQQDSCPPLSDSMLVNDLK